MRLDELLFALEERFWMEGAEYYRRHRSQVELEEHWLLELASGAAVVTYKATARRGDGTPYVARASSAYVNDGRTWKLAFHQQTPVA